MQIQQIISDPVAIDLWEENMHEPWADYIGADMFVVRDKGEIVGGFAVYRDDSDGVKGLFCSGWAKHGAHVPTGRILKQLAKTVGDVFFKTDQRTAKILLERIGEKVKTANGFGYYIVKGQKKNELQRHCSNDC